MLARNSLINDLALTTNGIFLAKQAQILRDAGLHRITVSLDTLRPQTFRDLTRQDAHAQVLEGIEAVLGAHFAEVKLDTVVVKGINEDELGDIVEFSRQRNIEPRFIEYMDVGGATQWSMNQVVSRSQIIEILSQRYGRIEPLMSRDRAPAERFLLPDGMIFGIVASTTSPFCQQCDRSRLTADGIWLLCLYALTGLDLRQMLRGGASSAEVQSKIVDAWQGREYREAEERTALRLRAALVGIEQLRGDPHLEMHTRGG
jgi:cyclic pyranopterin phosphate synthase